MAGSSGAGSAGGRGSLDSKGPLHTFDWRTNGPLLGISDGGDQAVTILAAGENSARHRTGGDARNGLILDLERMGSSGETPVGPPEYATADGLDFSGSFLSTNVGVRANARIYQPYQVVDANGGDGAGVASQVIALFEPFMSPPDNSAPRPLRVRLDISGDGVDAARLTAIAAAFEAARGGAVAADRQVHRIGGLVAFDTAIGASEAEAIEARLGDCAAAGIDELAIDAPWTRDARLRNGIQGVLNVLPLDIARRLLAAARAAGVVLVHHLATDIETITRTIWQGLSAARHEGLNAAKYGLTPLTLEEQRPVVHAISGWFPDWTAVPAFYVDTPLVAGYEIYLSDRLVEAAKLWLDMVAETDTRLVLFDAPDRYTPRVDVEASGQSRRMVRPDGDTVGALSLEQIAELHAYASAKRIGILWSGGIRPEHAFPLGKIGAAGIFTTGSTAIPAPVGESLSPDPRLSSQPKPTDLGVRRVHALLMAGFVAGKDEGVDLAALEAARLAVEQAASNSDELQAAIGTLDLLVEAALARMWN